jgi:nucleoside-diphosphate-sugar epimerase
MSATQSSPTGGDAKKHAGARVCVTGATGYLGSHVVKELLAQGYRVRAVVRDPGNEDNVGHLRTLVEAPAHPLELVRGDIMSPETLDEPLQGCELVCHMASSVRLFAKDPQRDIVDVAVKGTHHVLAAVRRVGAARRVILTSSVAAITDHTKPEGYVFTEADWNGSADLKVTPYLLSKTLAERAAWTFHAGLPEAERFELVALNPVVVMGPLYKKAHVRSSPNTLLDLLARRMPACPRLYFGVVDVRDVARAHRLALELPGASGRYILHNRGLWIREMAQLIAPRFPGYAVPTWPLPDIAVYAAALFDKRLSIAFLRQQLGRSVVLDNSRSRRELGLEYRPMEETLVDTCQSFIDLGMVHPRR